MSETINTYTFYWLDGTREVLKGESVAQAFTHAGYGAGARSALDFVSNGENNDYQWIDGKWKRIDKES
jgi:hypothetical protein